MDEALKTLLESPIKKVLQQEGGKQQTYTDSQNRTVISSFGTLIVNGQGVVSVVLKERTPFSIDVVTNETLEQGIRLVVLEEGVKLYELEGGTETLLDERSGLAIGLDEDKEATYWFSFFGQNRAIHYGKGEMRSLTTLLEYVFPDDGGDPSKFWMNDLSKYNVSSPSEVTVWKDPVTAEPPLIVLPTDKFTMMDAAEYRAVVPNALSQECQELYSNVVGKSFVLNTPDFPDFTDAIEASIRNPNGWCYKKLEEKKSEFGGEGDIKATYLRITLGVNQGWSPGIPYVLEIWPAGHYSPIHNHAGANAIIRVLHGEIGVNLYAMLSINHQQPFAQKILVKDDVTWISPGLNQIHQLKNINENGPTCMTIQCYLYNQSNRSHYEYFDYIDNEGTDIGHYYPDSDMEFPEFKALMRSEWLGNVRPKEWWR
ncbi:cysteine dioxygenase [Zooshikella ganghwensis]|uniref:Cysteine dioxygenase n=1 Tax=Zooshikella ganghwensis TaxID=202772 RepID=A0A4P9VRY1_9GAMM|nr:cysteine dioxygenase family protein [Zooshikella ganghwensis]RDH46368.1 hypothetical protein B9G39_24560 [Zooshikella ganghwensis]